MISLNEMIAELEALREQYGGNIEVRSYDSYADNEGWEVTFDDCYPEAKAQFCAAIDDNDIDHEFILIN